MWTYVGNIFMNIFNMCACICAHLCVCMPARSCVSAHVYYNEFPFSFNVKL